MPQFDRPGRRFSDDSIDFKCRIINLLLKTSNGVIDPDRFIKISILVGHSSFPGHVCV